MWGQFGPRGELGPVPYLVTLLILVTAATLESRWLLPSLLAALLCLGAEAVLSPLARFDQAALVTSGIITAVTFVVSLLHVRGTEQAFALAAARDEARAEAARLAHEKDEQYRLIAGQHR